MWSRFVRAHYAPNVLKKRWSNHLHSFRNPGLKNATSLARAIQDFDDRGLNGNTTENTCNCRHPSLCPLERNCQASGVVYKCIVQSQASSTPYIWLTKKLFFSAKELEKMWLDCSLAPALFFQFYAFFRDNSIHKARF